jgi:hypothetical protein
MNDQTADYYLQALNTPNPLQNLEQTIRNHWLKYRPKMCQELAATNSLETSIQTAARLTEEAVLTLTSQGVSLWEAWMQVREEWAILPTEEDQPTLGTSPSEWQMPPEPDDD